MMKPAGSPRTEYTTMHMNHQFTNHLLSHYCIAILIAENNTLATNPIAREKINIPQTIDGSSTAAAILNN